MKKLRKKLLGIFLVVTMLVATVSPVQGMAAENADTGYENVPKTEASGDNKPSGNISGVTQDDGEENTAPKYDVNMPVIESFDFEENGQALTVNDTLHFTMSAYDADSGIRSIYVYVYSREYGYGWHVSFEKSEEGNLYTGTLPCSELKGNQFYVSEIRVEDKADNYVNWNTWDSETGQERYTFTLDYKMNIDNNVTVSNFRMQKNSSNPDGKLRPGDIVTYMADVSCDNGEKITSCYAYVYAYANNFSTSEYMELSYNEDTHTLTGTFTVTDRTYPTEWYLNEIYIGTESGKYYYFYPSSLDAEADLRFEVVQEDFDTDPPIIESITVDKNGQFVKPGDVVTIKVKVKEEHPREYASAHFYPQVTNVLGSSYVNLEYDVETRAYTGTITITEDTYPCEWALTDLYIYDETENRTSLYDFRPDYYEMLPWYYKVRQGNYREDVKKVTFEFYGFAKQEDGSYQPNSLISTQMVENVGRRTTLKDLGVSFPQPIEGVTAAWKYGWPGWDNESRRQVIDENTKLLFSSTENMTYVLSASYDKVCANVSLTYMADSGIKTAIIPKFVDEGTTYREVLNALELPEDAVVDEFVGFDLSYSDDYHNESMQVGVEEKYYSAWIEAKAKYKDCQVAWNARYIGQDGKETSKIINKSYLEGTQVSDALAELEKPEDIDGMEFEAWVLVSPDVEEISKPMTSLEIVAVYRGKTTVDAVYTYRGEDGAIASNSGMVFIDGENLSDAEIQGAATGVFKEVNHYKGLKLSEWTGTIGVNQARYKTVEFKALYQNCVLTLKYPDGTSQYIIVNKNAQYTLPTENEKYKDIVWKGFKKGETVTVKEDREFIVKDSKLQDGTEEGPQGVKLTADKIASIIEQIENAKAGDDPIEVDMGKATVVPKEVLEAIKGKSVEIRLNLGEYNWTIKGTKVLATELKDIDLEVTIGTDVIPSSLVSSLAGDKPVTQISLTHNGDFGFQADLGLNLGSENSGGTGSLYYYDSTGKLVFMNSGKIGADGSTSLSFSHASDYVIVIDKADSPDNDKKDEVADIKKKESNPTTDSGSAKTDLSYRKSPKTGE